MKEIKRPKGPKLHNNSKPQKKHKCSHCPYEAAQKSNLKRHVREVHETIRNYTCKKCGYAATERGKLMQHEQAVHNIQFFKCEKCPYASAATLQRLQNHIKTVHERIRDHVCQECGYATSEKGHLREHMKGIHKMGNKVKCDQCPYSSYRKRLLKMHVQRVHDKIFGWEEGICFLNTM